MSYVRNLNYIIMIPRKKNRVCNIRNGSLPFPRQILSLLLFNRQYIRYPQTAHNSTGISDNAEIRLFRGIARYFTNFHIPGRSLKEIKASGIHRAWL